VKVLSVIDNETSLRKPCQPVVHFEGMPSIAESMIATMKRAGGIGLAASQVGRDERCFVMYSQPNNILFAQILTVINPEIVSETGQAAFIEGCLSLPGFQERIIRSNDINVKFQDVKGQMVEMQLSGIAAVTFQHELDHLNGMLAIDRASESGKKRYGKFLAKKGKK